MNNTQKQIDNMRQDRLNDLFREWGQRTRNVQKLQANMPSNQNKAVNKLSLMERITRWITQLVLLKRKEHDIISQICEVEKQHNHLKKTKQLKRAHIKRETLAPQNQKKKSNFWFWMLVLMLLSKKKKPESSLILQNG